MKVKKSLKKKKNESKNGFERTYWIGVGWWPRRCGLGLLGGGDEVDWATELTVWWWWWGCCGGGGGGGIRAEDWVCELEIQRSRERESEYRECFIFEK